MGARALRDLGAARKSPPITRSPGGVWTITDLTKQLVAFTVWTDLQGEVTHVWQHSYRDTFKGTALVAKDHRSDRCLWRRQDETGMTKTVSRAVRLVKEAQRRGN